MESSDWLIKYECVRHYFVRKRPAKSWIAHSSRGSSAVFFILACRTYVFGQFSAFHIERSQKLTNIQRAKVRTNNKGWYRLIWYRDISPAGGYIPFHCGKHPLQDQGSPLDILAVSPHIPLTGGYVILGQNVKGWPLILEWVFATMEGDISPRRGYIPIPN